MSAIQPELQRLARRLYRRRDEGVIVPFVRVDLDGWRPQEQDCHANVDYWVLSRLAEEECQAVRGWLYFERSLRGCPSFLSHSVVETAERKLIDITPSRAAKRYPFIRHKGRPGEYERLLERHGLIALDYRAEGP
jgi:hypothetical protein